MNKKKTKNSGLGRALVKAKWGGKNNSKDNYMENLLSVDDDEKTKQERAQKLMSVTQRNDLQELLDLAQLSDQQFVAEKERVFIVTNQSFQVKDEKFTVNPNETWNEITIPRRPKWTNDMPAEVLHKLEKQAFLEWRRKLAKMEENEAVLMSPFEKNPEVWKQLWRVVEKCSVLVQIVDSRNPMLFRCPDLEKYVKEVDPNKKNILLLNKADLLSPLQRKEWASFFRSQSIESIFFSANLEQQKLDAGEMNEDKEEEEEEEEDKDIKILDRSNLLAYLYSFKKEEEDLMVGMIGYPNVGKSSTINVLVGQKKVAVAPTPGKTKHFQTVVLENGITLCDCPGLVFPTRTSTKADMICNGLLSIDHLRDHIPPVALVCQRIPRWVFNKVYSISIPLPLEHEDQNRNPTPFELLHTYAKARGLLAQHGIPNEPQAARRILKDYVNGKLCFVYPPPHVKDAIQFNSQLYDEMAPISEEKDTEEDENSQPPVQSKKASRRNKPKKKAPEDSQEFVQAFTTGRQQQPFTRPTFGHYSQK